jgi:hypothetical protein
LTHKRGPFAQKRAVRQDKREHYLMIFALSQSSTNHWIGRIIELFFNIICQTWQLAVQVTKLPWDCSKLQSSMNHPVPILNTAFSSMVNSDLHPLTAPPKPLPMYQVTSHFPNPSRICYSANRNCGEAHQCNPLELLWTVEEDRNDVLT